MAISFLVSRHHTRYQTDFQTTFCLNCYKSSLSPKNKLLICTMFLRPILLYGAIIVSSASIFKIRRFNIFQNRIWEDFSSKMLRFLRIYHFLSLANMSWHCPEPWNRLLHMPPLRITVIRILENA